MSLNFVTRKLKTQKLEEDQEEDKVVQSDIDEVNVGESDSGTESDDEGVDEAPEGKKNHVVLMPLHSNFVVPHEDNYSSEEELKEIINEQSAASEKSMKKKSPSKKEKKLSTATAAAEAAAFVKTNVFQDPDQIEATSNSPASGAANKAGNGTGSGAPPGSMKVAGPNAEKRKWSEVISDDDLGNFDEEDDGLELEMTSSSSARSSRLYVRSAGGNTTASSSCSNEDDSCVCGRRLTTPVQFCTSPPMDVHRPRRKPWTPPPPKVFHVMASNHSASFDLTQEEDEEIVDIENRSRPRQAAFLPVTTGTGDSASASISNGLTSNTSASSSESPEQGGSASAINQYCPRHHHHTQQQQQQQRQTPSPSKRHRLTPRPHNIQRPCLDFEKMQQIKKRVVTSWRPQGAELSLFCW